jgi:4a-hydroxytetrahydrobiopterin dehydratase
MAGPDPWFTPAADLAESEGHHPNLRIDYNVVTVTVWTHAVDGLTRNDFILAAKLDESAADMK